MYSWCHNACTNVTTLGGECAISLGSEQWLRHQLKKLSCRLDGIQRHPPLVVTAVGVHERDVTCPIFSALSSRRSWFLATANGIPGRKRAALLLKVVTLSNRKMLSEEPRPKGSSCLLFSLFLFFRKYRTINWNCSLSWQPGRSGELGRKWKATGG